MYICEIWILFLTAADNELSLICQPAAERTTHHSGVLSQIQRQLMRTYWLHLPLFPVALLGKV